MPIFYTATPDDVKLRTELFKKELREHEKQRGEEQVKKWGEALKVVARIKGREVKTTGRHSPGCPRAGKPDLALVRLRFGLAEPDRGREAHRGSEPRATHSASNPMAGFALESPTQPRGSRTLGSSN
ncbi:hypothetical protein CRG98_033480 [Punica granatum]|uniref:TIR domain-containing protein n=1 Tax=Punica granatum TaxID=22663 RepID=A0A2I0IQ66_PUNGR|nr:hypothetical protein CRG98_033480 [Punica granatum]